MRKGNTRIMHMGDTILDAAAESRIDEDWCLFKNQSTCNTFINEEYLYMLPMGNIYVSIVTQK